MYSANGAWTGFCSEWFSSGSPVPVNPSLVGGTSTMAVTALVSGSRTSNPKASLDCHLTVIVTITPIYHNPNVPFAVRSLDPRDMSGAPQSTVRVSTRLIVRVMHLTLSGRARLTMRYLAGHVTANPTSTLKEWIPKPLLDIYLHGAETITSSQ